MSSPVDRRKLCFRAEKVYRWFLGFCPKRFRNEFGEQMTQLFRDQWNDAHDAGTSVVRIRFWFRVLADTGRTACYEHITELKDFMIESLIKSLLQRPNLTFTKLFAAAFLLFAGVLVTKVVFLVPRSYCSTARVIVDWPPVEVKWPQSSMVGTDPLFIRTESEKLKSKAVLDQVVEELGLSKWLSQQTGSTSLSPNEATATLKKMVIVRLVPNTTLLGVDVFCKDRIGAAEIANKIVDVYRRQTEAAKASRRIVVIEKAVPDFRPVRPNVPFSLFIITVSSIVFAGAIAFLIRRIVSKPAVQITQA